MTPINLDEKVTPHFRLGELVPSTVNDIPEHVRHNLQRLCVDLLEPIREACGPVVVTSGWRPPAHNSRVGGTRTSDHTYGRAADIYILSQADLSWEYMTEAAFRWVSLNLRGKYGQVILEDHRRHYDSPGKLWVHIAVTSEKHPGHDDPNMTLVSNQPGRYERYLGGDGA